ncbi:hypothetical protein [Candidatus Albibeggiatoa sp. nov. BB20]|uniref:hypothetical protein n=1 Tax=Candidatus Albibeggiatoa sp. nov. BB20 TaxID=3162723 RepID=UPI00336596FC
MSALSIQQKINRLPPELLTEVEQFLDKLLSQKKSKLQPPIHFESEQDAETLATEIRDSRLFNRERESF